MLKPRHHLQALQSANPSRRRRAALALIHSDTDEVIQQLLDSLTHSDSQVNSWAAWILGQIESETVVKGLLQMLSHDSSQVRTWVVWTLTQKFSLDAQKGLLTALEDTNAELRWRAAIGLGNFSTQEVISKLLFALSDSDYRVVGQAAAALGKIGAKRAIPDLEKIQGHSEFSVRFQVARALSKLGTEQALNKLDLNVDQETTPQTFEIPVTSDSSCPPLLISGYTEASQYILSSPVEKSVQHLVSIGSPGIDPPDGYEQVPHRLRLEFDDITHPDYYPNYVLATPKDLQKLLNFINSVTQWQGYLLVHCQAGISRSSAIALAIFSYLLGEGKEREALAYVQKAQPQAKPNLWIVELADDLLGRRGKLVRAVEREIRYSG